MEYQYQKRINLLGDTTDQASKFWTRHLVETNDQSKGRQDNNNIRFKISIIRSNLCDYSNACILVKGTITVPNTATVGTIANNTNKKVIFENFAPFNDCIIEINNAQIDDAYKIDGIRRHQEVFGNTIEMNQL